MVSSKKQNGFALLMVVMVLAVITLLVVSTSMVVVGMQKQSNAFVESEIKPISAI